MIVIRALEKRELIPLGVVLFAASLVCWRCLATQTYSTYRDAMCRCVIAAVDPGLRCRGRSCLPPRGHALVIAPKVGFPGSPFELHPKFRDFKKELRFPPPPTSINLPTRCVTL